MKRRVDAARDLLAAPVEKILFSDESLFNCSDMQRKQYNGVLSKKSGFPDFVYFFADQKQQKSNPTNRERAILWMHDSAAAPR